MIYYKRFIGDYQRDTGDLTPLQHGIYALLLDHYYATERPLPLDRGALHRITRAMTDEEHAACGYVVDNLFKRTPAGYRNARCDRQIADESAYLASKKNNAKARWDKEKNATAYANGHAKGMPPQPQPLQSFDVSLKPTVVGPVDKSGQTRNEPDDIEWDEQPRPQHQ